MTKKTATHCPFGPGLFDPAVLQFLSRLAMVLLLVVVAGLLATSAQAQTFTVLYPFTGGADGLYPIAGVIRDSLGTLYGTTLYGGAYDKGTVFKLSPAGHKTVLYSFRGRSGAGPNWGLIPDSQGSLYGTTDGGGNLTCNSGMGCGTVFKLDKTGKVAVLHAFSYTPDGAFPRGLIRDAAGSFYGVSLTGGATTSDSGVVYKLDPSDNLTVLDIFTGGSDGADPFGALVRDSQGNLYGTTGAGGPGNFGTVFKVDSSGNGTVLHIFTHNPDGDTPYGGMVRDSVGNLYGTTLFGGLNGGGTVFRVDPSGAETVLHSFGAGTDGGVPDSGLIRDTSGNFYGVTEVGGEYGWGTVYKMDSSNNVTVLYSFTGKADGKYPIGTLTRDSAGTLYGTTQKGGAYGWGVVFKLAP